jgi:hypothetical protein
MKKLLLNRIDEKLNEGKLVDAVYNALVKIPEFKNLSMDRQGEISTAVEKMIKK